MKILFSSNEWKTYSPFLKENLLKNKFNPKILINCSENFQDDIKYIIYSPNSNLQNFQVFPNLKAVLSLWAGVEKIVKNKTLNVPLVRLIDKDMTQGMIEWCTAHILRYHLETDRYVLNKNKNWDSEFFPSLSRQKNIGILGYGTLGKAVGKKLKKFGFNVFGWTKRKKSFQKKINLFNGNEGLNEMLPNIDILLILLPLTKYTENIVNKDIFKLLKKNCYVINAGRGQVLNDKDLLDYLNNDHIKHATLDVFNEEPLPKEHPFWSNPKITVSPHIAAVTRPSSASKVIINNIIQFENKKEPLGIVNRQEEY